LNFNLSLFNLKMKSPTLLPIYGNDVHLDGSNNDDRVCTVIITMIMVAYINVYINPYTHTYIHEHC
jgi:hypothetical protein